MSDKVQKIKEEVERLKNHTLDIQKSEDGLVTSVGRGRVEAFNDVLKFIDSLPEEPASEDLKEEIERWIKKKHFVFTEVDEIIETARHFAEWKKQQMMKDAVDGEIVYQIGSAEIAPTDMRYKVMSDRVYIPNVKLGDKVKLIIVKDD